MKPAYLIFSAALLISIAYAATPVKNGGAGCSVTEVVRTKEVVRTRIVYRYITIATKQTWPMTLTDKTTVKAAAKVVKVKKPVKIKGCKRGRTRKHGVCGRWK